MEININRKSTIPIYLQISNHIRESILSGAMPAGYKLPPERKFAQRLCVNRSTVLNAYRELKASGLIDSHIGRGTVVADFVLGAVGEEANRRMAQDNREAISKRQDVSEAIYKNMSNAGYDSSSEAIYKNMSNAGYDSSNEVVHGSTNEVVHGSTNEVVHGSANEVVHGSANGAVYGSTNGVLYSSTNGALSGEMSSNLPMPPMPWDQLFSESSLRMRDTTVRNLLKLSGKKDMVLFAAGVTAPGMDSLEALQRIQTEVVKSHGHTAVQHLPSDGFYPLRESISKFMGDRGIYRSAAETMVLSGSQQGLDLVARAFIDPGDIVFVEEPTFFSAIHIFKAAGARVVGVPIDSDGLRTDVLSMLLKRFKPKIIYTIPDFQNPSGAVMSIERRKELLSLAHKNQIILLEDDPYGMLRYEGNGVPALKAMDVHDNVLYLSTFSKLLFPGFRVGWISGPQQVLHRLTILKQTADLHTSSLPQLIFNRFLREGLMGSHMKMAIKENRKRRDIMHDELMDAKLEGLSLNRPEGGLYLWCRLPDVMLQSRLLSQSVDNGVSFVPGNVFFREMQQVTT